MTTTPTSGSDAAANDVCFVVYPLPSIADEGFLRAVFRRRLARALFFGFAPRRFAIAQLRDAAFAQRLADFLAQQQQQQQQQHDDAADVEHGDAQAQDDHAAVTTATTTTTKSTERKRRRNSNNEDDADTAVARVQGWLGSVPAEHATLADLFAPLPDDKSSRSNVTAHATAGVVDVDVAAATATQSEDDDDVSYIARLTWRGRRVHVWRSPVTVAEFYASGGAVPQRRDAVTQPQPLRQAVNDDNSKNNNSSDNKKQARLHSHKAADEATTTTTTTVHDAATPATRQRAAKAAGASSDACKHCGSDAHLSRHCPDRKQSSTSAATAAAAAPAASTTTRKSFDGKDKDTHARATTSRTAAPAAATTMASSSPVSSFGKPRHQSTPPLAAATSTRRPHAAAVTAVTAASSRHGKAARATSDACKHCGSDAHLSRHCPNKPTVHWHDTLAMPVRAPVDLTNVDIDFSRIDTTASTAAGSGGAHGANAAAKVAALLASVDGNNNNASSSTSNNNNNDDGSRERGAFDPTMQSYLQRHAQQQQRRRHRSMSFFASSSSSSSSSSAALPPSHVPYAEPQTDAMPVRASREQSSAADTNNNNNDDDDTSKAAAAQFVAEATSVEHTATARARRRAYVRALRQFCRGRSDVDNDDDDDVVDDHDATTTTTTALAVPAVRFSMLQQLFVDGVPDVEPWDSWAFAVPRYDLDALVTNNNNNSSSLDAVRYVHHAVLPDSHYTTHYQHRELDALAQSAHAQQQQLQRMKTRDERRAERRARQQAKQQAARAVAAAAALPVTTGNSGSSSQAMVPTPVRDRLSTRALALQLFTRSVLNPLATETRVLSQYEQRYLEHQRRNHDRHVAALPAQVQKRARDVARHARERPLLRAYRIWPIYSPGHLAKLRLFANDAQLRGFVLWVAQCDALVVLAGGEVAMRHLDQWMLHKMRWESDETHARRLCTVRLCDAHTFSFHRKSRHATAATTTTATTTTNAAEAANADDTAHEAVFMCFVDTIDEGDAFLRTVVPAPGSPWRDLTALWRVAFLAHGLTLHKAQ